MKKLTVFDKYKTPEEWKRQALENPHKGKPKLKRWEFAAAVCTTCTVIICMVMLPYINSAYQSANQPEDTGSQIYASSADKSTDRSEINKRIVERMCSDFDCVVTGIILGGDENTSAVSVYVTEKTYSDLYIEINTGTILYLSLQPTGWCYTENSKTSGIVGIGKNIGRLAAFGLNSDSDENASSTTADGYADLGEANDPTLNGVIETADLLTNNGEETYFGQTKYNMIVNSFQNISQIQPHITDRSFAYNIQPMSVVSYWYDEGNEKEYNSVYRLVYIFKLENKESGAVSGEIVKTDENAAQLKMKDQNTEETFTVAADIGGIEARTEYSIIKKENDNETVYLKAEVTPRSYAEYLEYADIAFCFGREDIDSLTADVDIRNALSECVIDYCYQDKGAELDNGKMLQKMKIEMSDDAGFSAECVKRGLAADDDEKSEVRDLQYVIRLEAKEPIDDLMFDDKTDELLTADKSFAVNIVCTDKEGNIINPKDYHISVEDNYYNGTVQQYIMAELKINTSVEDISEITPVLKLEENEG